MLPEMKSMLLKQKFTSEVKNDDQLISFFPPFLTSVNVQARLHAPWLILLDNLSDTKRFG